MDADMMGICLHMLWQAWMLTMMAHMPPECMEGMDAGMMAHMPPEAMAGMDADMMGHMPPECMEGMDAGMMSTHAARGYGRHGC